MSIANVNCNEDGITMAILTLVIIILCTGINMTDTRKHNLMVRLVPYRLYRRGTRIAMKTACTTVNLHEWTGSGF